MNAFLSMLDICEASKRDAVTKRCQLSTLQVNLGNLCNQHCLHCHVDASPQGRKIMSKNVMDEIIRFLSRHKGLILDITAGAPELNPYFDYFVMETKPFVKEIIVRSNLTVLFEPGKEYLPELYKKYNIHLICSLPCYEEGNVDSQRGNGVFKKSIEAMKLLNRTGYSTDKGLLLDLVYNPTGANLPPKQEELEKEYKRALKERYGVEFSKLVTITNVPIKRFKEYLHSQGEYNNYVKLLKDNFNPNAVENIMCREYLSVGYDGKLYDCDFNQSLGWVLKNKEGQILTIDKINLKDLEKREIMVGEHCLSCTAGYGSSCRGALDLKDSVKSYYGRVLQATADLKTDACCAIDSIPSYHRDILNKIHPEIRNKFYGCGSPIPPLLEGRTILDLGCGTGRDVYLASALAGRDGFVLGVDMTDEQLATARRHINYQMEKFNFTKPNVEFKKGYIEDLKNIGIKDSSVDVVISNCVINLSPDKKAVFSELFRILKPGGELYFSDVFTERRMPDYLKSDPVLYGECLGGALYIEDFRRLLREVGCLDYRTVSRRRIDLNNSQIEEKAGMIDFYSITVRAFKLDDLEDICEDYGQTAMYLGTIPHNPHSFAFDDHHIFIAKKPMLVCGNTASMLQNTRYSEHFEIKGNRTIHFGRFDCAPALVKVGKEDKNIGGACC